MVQTQPQALRQQKKRRRIIETASRVFAERDYHAVTMDEIAQRSGVGKGTLYRYFDSKEDLFIALMDEGLALLADRLEEEQKAEVPPAEILSRMIHAIVRSFCQHLPFFRILNGDKGRLIVRKKQLFKERRRRLVTALGRVLERGMASGVFRQVDPEVTPSLLIGMVWGMVLNHSGQTTPEALARVIVDLFLRGTLVPESGAR
jgi:AcrR family transcriptional regulator